MVGIFTFLGVVWDGFDIWSNLEFIGQKSGLIWEVIYLLFATQTGARIILVVFAGLFVGSLLFQIERTRPQLPSDPPPPALTAPSAATAALPEAESFKSLTELAAKQAADIGQWVYSYQALLGRHNLLRDNPYIDFRFRIRNMSVFVITAESLSGTITIGGEPLSGTVQWIEPLENVHPGAGRPQIVESECAIRLTLQSEKESVLILNQGGSFEFNQLTIPVRDTEKTIKLPVRLRIDGDLSNNELLEAYPKLQMRSGAQKLISLSRGRDPFRADEGSVVLIQLSIENRRDVPIRTQQFRLILIIGGFEERRVPAQQGVIFDNALLQNGEVKQTGNKLNNLAEQPIVVERGNPIDGWLQFVIRDGSAYGFQGRSVNLEAVDDRGEKHPTSVVLGKMEPIS